MVDINALTGIKMLIPSPSLKMTAPIVEHPLISDIKANDLDLEIPLCPDQDNIFCSEAHFFAHLLFIASSQAVQLIP